MVEAYSILQVRGTVVRMLREYFGSSSTRAVILATPTDEMLPVIGVPAVHIPDLHEAQGVPTVSNPEILRVQKYPQST